MKKLNVFLNLLIYLLVVIVLIAALGSSIYKKPLLMSAIRSNSMYPLFKKGDMIFIKSLSPNDNVKIGDIVVFKTEEGDLSSKGWIVHRVVDITKNNKYITKGDANELSDQESGETVPIKREWISSKVITLGSHVLKIPLLGYLPLWMENIQHNPYLLPSISVILAIIIGISELTNSKKKKKNRSLELQMVYFLGGITLSIIIGVTMLISSSHIVLSYEISENDKGVIMGSSVGILKVGEMIEKPLSDLNNQGFIPIVATISSNDTQLSFSKNIIMLKPGDNIKTKFIVNAKNPGKYKSNIWIGMFYPFLPKKVIYQLVSKSFWLAIIVLSLIPGLPLLLYPIIDKKLRKRTLKEIRHLNRRIRKFLSFINY